MAIEFELRPATDGERDFIFEVYASTRADEMDALGWPSRQREAFLRMQFEAREAHYRQHHPEAFFQIIVVDGAAVGAICVDRRENRLQIVDIALLAAYRDNGLGSRVLQAIVDEAAKRALPVRLHVLAGNPAVRLYRRLGFNAIAEDGVHVLMEWTPG